MKNRQKLYDQVRAIKNPSPALSAYIDHLAAWKDRSSGDLVDDDLDFDLSQRI